MPARSRSQPGRSTWKLATDWLQRRPVWTFAVISACWVAWLYGNALAGPFVYDDIDQIQRNSGLASWTALGTYFGSAPQFRAIAPGVSGSFYRPLFWASLILDRHLWGLAPAGFHFTNLALHWANGLLAFLLLRRLGMRPAVAAAAAVVWIGLPVNSESVAWISGRPYDLLAFFLLASLWAAGQYHESRGKLALLGYAAASLAALLSHEAGVLVLPMTLLAAYLGRRPRATWAPLLVAGVAMDGVWFLLRQNAGASAPGFGAILPAGSTIWKYIGWMLLPVHMSVERSTDTPANTLSFGALASWIVLAAGAWAVVRWRRKSPAAAAGLAWMAVALVPFSGIVFLYQGMAERYTYLASLGLAVALTALAVRTPKVSRPAVVAVLALWTLCGAWRLQARVRDWDDEEALYATSLATNPHSSVLLYNLGVLAERRGASETAAGYYRRALAQNPEYAPALAGLGDVDLLRGDKQEARRHYEASLALDPQNASAALNLAATWQLLGSLGEAEQQYRRAIALDPGRARPHADLGVVLAQEGKLDEAIGEMQQALALDPTDRNVYQNLGLLYRRTGQPARAAEMFAKAASLAPPSGAPAR